MEYRALINLPLPGNSNGEATSIGTCNSQSVDGSLIKGGLILPSILTYSSLKVELVLDYMLITCQSHLDRQTTLVRTYVHTASHIIMNKHSADTWPKVLTLVLVGKSIAIKRRRGKSCLQISIHNTNSKRSFTLTKLIQSTCRPTMHSYNQLNYSLVKDRILNLKTW